MNTNDNVKLIFASLVGVVTLAGLGACSTQQHAKGSAGQLASEVEDADDETETPITVGDLPTAVRAALAGVTAEAQVTQVTRDIENGQTTYDVEYTKNGEQWAAEFTPAGDVLENESDGDNGDED